MPLSFYIKSDQDFLNLTLWIPRKSRDEGIVFCHGWGGVAGFDDLLELLAEKGYYALRLDQRGYGKSTGKGDLSLWASDMALCAETLGSVVKRVWAAGQSAGATIALVAAATQNCFIGAIGFGTFCSLDRIIKDNVSARNILEERFGPLQDRHFKAADALNLVQGLQKPVLLVHGTEDPSVPFEHGRLLSIRLGSTARFVPVQGGNHHLTNVDRSPVLAEVSNWLEKSRPSSEG